MQEAINALNTDNQRKGSKNVLVDLFNKAVDSDLLIKNVAKQINTVVTKESKKTQRVMTLEETKIFLEVSRGRFYFPLFVLALETGMRIGELAGLQWDDVDFEKKIIHVRHSLCCFPKSGKQIFEMHEPKTTSGARDIPLTSKAFYALKEQYLKKQNMLNKGLFPLDGYENLVFVTRNNHPLTANIVTQAIKTIVKEIGIQYPDITFDKITPHTFRHTFATRYIEMGIQPKTVQKLLGHSKLEMTMNLYCHVTNDTLYEAVEKYEQAVL